MPFAIACPKVSLTCMNTAVRGTVFVLDYARFEDWQPPVFSGLIALIERSAGRAHYDAFRDHMHRGGTETLLAETGIHVRARSRFLHGAVGLYVGRWELRPKISP